MQGAQGAVEVKAALRRASLQVHAGIAEDEARSRPPSSQQGRLAAADQKEWENTLKRRVSGGGHERHAQIAEQATDGRRDSELEQTALRAKAIFRRSVQKVCNTKQLTTLGERMHFGGGALVLGPGLPRDVRRVAPERSNMMLSKEISKGEPLPVSTQPPESRGEGPDRRATRRLLRLADPQSRMQFMRDHPFFKDTSMALRMRLAPQLVRRPTESNGREIVEQGAQPMGSMDYLFLTAPDLNTKVEILFDGRPVAVLSGSTVFGQEVVFGVSSCFAFGARVGTGLTSTSSSLWVIPRKVITSLLQKDAHKEDADILQARARETASVILSNWYSQPMAQIRIRLFENAEHAFKTVLVKAVTMEVHAKGEILRKFDEEGEDSCFCVFRGEASVHVPGESESIAKLSHASGTSAWAAWWGLLEVLGICSRSPAEVRTETDVVVWCLSPEALRSLRKNYPMECRLFDKVAREHAKLLQSTAPSIAEAPLFSGLGADLVEELMAAVRSEVYGVGTTILCEGEISDDLFFLARGKACVRRQNDMRGQPGHPIPPSTNEKRRASPKGGPLAAAGAGRNPAAEKVLAHFAEGSFFGEATVLGYCSERTASVVCETVCDVRVLPGSKLLELVAAHPGLAPRLLDLARDHGCRLSCEAAGRPAQSDLQALLGMELSTEVMQALDPDMGRLTTIRSQMVEKQGACSNTFYVLVEGAVAVEVDKKVVAEIQAPAILCEQALLQPSRPLPAGFRSKGVCFLRTLNSERARQILECLPDDRERMLRGARESMEDFLAMVAGIKRSKSRSKVMFSGQVSSDALALDGGDGSSPQTSAPRMERRGSFEEVGDDGVNFIDGKPTVAFLSRFFQESVEGFLEYISEGMYKVIFTEGEVLMREGDEGDFAVCIHRGSGTVEIGGVKVGEVKAGSLIGEAAVFGEGAKRTATVRAVGLVSAYKLPRHLLLEAFEEFPDERNHIMDLARIRGLTNKVLTAPRVVEKEDSLRGLSSTNPNSHSRRLSRFALDANNSLFGSISRAWSNKKHRRRLSAGSKGSAGELSPRPEHPPAMSRSQSSSMMVKSTTSLNSADRLLKHRGTLPIMVGGASSRRHSTRSSEAGQQSFSSRAASESSCFSDVSDEVSPQVSLRRGHRHSSVEDPATPRGVIMKTLSSNVLQVCAPQGSRTSSGNSSRPPVAPKASTKCSEWVQQRRKQIRDATLKRDQRLAKRGGLLPLVPSSEGYQSQEADVRAKGPSWYSRFRRAEGVYAPPVWHEVFGT